MHEIITLQIGTQANYVGSHFWNAQESYFTYDNEESPVNHDIHFRQGTGADGSDTYLPRTLIYDIKSEFGTLRQTNALYQLEDDENEPNHLSSNIIRQPRIPQHAYQQMLDDSTEPKTIDPSTIRYWSDYSRTLYHPRSLVPFHSSIATSDTAPMQSWETGIELFDKENSENDLIDRDFRYFLEECNQAQGVVIYSETDGAWGAFSSQYIQKLRDELGKTTMIVFGVENPINPNPSVRSDQQKLQNSLKYYHTVIPQSSLLCPISINQSNLSRLKLNTASRWEVSALQMMSTESLTLPSRLKYLQDSRILLSDVEQFFTFEHSLRNILQTKLKLPPLQTNGISKVCNNLQTEDRRTEDIIDLLSYPEFTKDVTKHDFQQIWVQRNHDKTILLNDTDSNTRLCSSQLEFPLLSSFPNDLFRSRSLNSHSLSIDSFFSTSSTVGKLIQNFASKTYLLPLEERGDIKNDFSTWAEEYFDGYESSGEYDDD